VVFRVRHRRQLLAHIINTIERLLISTFEKSTARKTTARRAFLHEQRMAADSIEARAPGTKRLSFAFACFDDGLASLRREAIVMLRAFGADVNAVSVD
jgi:hypothetical protein